MDELVDILEPQTFQKSGITKTRKQAREDGDWIATFNLWIIQNSPTPSIVYQLRSANSRWEPNKLDVTAGGHLSAGEEPKDGIREAKEELGKDYNIENALYLGKRLNVSKDINNKVFNSVVHLYIILDNTPLESYQLEENEVYAICACPIVKLLKVHTQDNYSFEVEAINNNGQKFNLTVTHDSFPYNWDNYHYKIALLADSFLKGEKDLIY